MHFGSAVGLGIPAGDMIDVFFEYTEVACWSAVAWLAGRDIPAKDCAGSFISTGALLGKINNDAFGCRY
jgi:hypothetical protein